MRKQLRRFLSTALVGMMLSTCMPAAYADTGGSVFDPNIRSEDDEDDDLASSSDAIEVTTYGELQAALASASNGTNIEILGDLSPDDGSITLNGELDAITGATLVTTASDVKVEGNGYTISGKGYPTFDSDGGDLTVENLTIDGAGYAAKLGGAVFVEYGGTLTMQNVTMQNCVAGSTAEYGGGGAVYVNNHGAATPTFTAIDCRFINNSTPNGRGGAIYGSTGNVVLEDCYFADNSADNGGAIAMDGTGELTMTGCQVTGNSAQTAGGGVYIYHGESTSKKSGTITSRVVANIDSTNEIDGNEAGLAGDDIVYGRFYGTSYSGDDTELILTTPVYDEILFTDITRTAVARLGAEIEVTTYGKLQEALANASNGTRIEIKADLSPTDGSITLGDTLDAITGATMTVTGRDITVAGNNHTIEGNGYPTFDSDGGDLTVEDLTIDGAGYAAKLGGAVFVEYGGTLTMQNVTMQNCVAASTAEYGGGGAVYVNNHGGDMPVFTAIDCRFINNSTANGRGGAIYGSQGNVILDGCVFEQNSAANGGAIAMDNTSELTMTNCQMEDNHASIGGGAVYIYHGNSDGKKNSVITSRVTAVIDDSNQFKDNSAGLVGDDILYGRFYTADYSGDKAETTLTASVFEDVTFTSLSRDELAEQVDDTNTGADINTGTDTNSNGSGSSTGSSSSSGSSSGSSSISTGSKTSTGSWESNERGWWYRYNDGTWPTDCWIHVSYNNILTWYHFDNEGYMQTGWITDTNGHRYYLNPISDGTQGAMKVGWVSIDNSWYYLNDGTTGIEGSLLTSATTPDGYQVDQNGVWK